MRDFIFMKLFESVILYSPTCLIVILLGSSNRHITSLAVFKNVDIFMNKDQETILKIFNSRYWIWINEFCLFFVVTG